MNFKKLLSQHEVDAILITSRENNYYLSSFKASLSYILITKDKNFFYTDSRYIENAKKNIKSNFEVTNLNEKSIIEELQEEIQKRQLKKFAFENIISVGTFDSLKKQLKNVSLKTIDLTKLRIIKEEKEVAFIEKANNIAIKAFKALISEIKIGMTEKELANKLVFLMKEFGGEKESFDPIVAAGKNGSNPHWRASNYKIKNNDMITFDFGCIYKGYCSDITRTIVINDFRNKEEETIYNVVLKAQKSALGAIKPNMKIKDLDNVARNIIKEEKWGKYFNHSLGHGLGILIHEAPTISNQSKEVLKPGMIITIEPGIYIPNKCGVRIEDDVLVTKTSYKVLTKNLTKNIIKVKG